MLIITSYTVMVNAMNDQAEIPKTHMDMAPPVRGSRRPKDRPAARTGPPPQRSGRQRVKATGGVQPLFEVCACRQR